MPIVNGDGGSPLLELCPITDFYVDGLHHIEVLGENVRMVYFRWRHFEGVWRMVAAEFARICPANSIPMEKFIARVPVLLREAPRIGLHS